MPRKTKEINEEKVVKKQPKSNKKIDTLIENLLEPDEKVVVDVKPSKKSKATSASTTKVKVPASKTVKAKTDKLAVADGMEKVATRKNTKARIKTEKATENATKKDTVNTKSKSSKKDNEEKSTAKKSSKATKSSVVKSSTSKTSTKAKTGKVKTTTKTKSSADKATVRSAKVDSPVTVEYYDLPYRYNQTVVKVLYQNPTTLFVYWEISDSDIENYKKTYGENFFETTRPVLVVYNDTMNYHFEVDINDFANSWYFHINDSKCNYRVELVRRPVFYNEKIKTDYVYISSSNKIESPNDRILFSTDEPYTVYFRNTKNNKQRKVNLPKLLEQLNLANKEFGFPIVRSVYDLYKNIYHVEDVGEFSISLTNPSSGNPSSHSLSSRSF